MEKGITIAGSIVVDKIKTIERYPRMGMQSDISSLQQTMGGLVSNTGIALMRFDPELKVIAQGCVGSDADGKFALGFMEKNGMDVSDMIVKEGMSTSFTDVFSITGGERTFFQFAGANAEYGIDEIMQKPIRTEIFHAGYLLMMPKLDKADSEYGTVLARALHNIQKKGIKTSIDVVSKDGGDYVGIVGAALKYTDYFIVNEIEAGNCTGIAPRDSEGKLIRENIRKILKKAFEMGVGELAVIHCPEGGFALDRDGDYAEAESLKLPEGYIVGTVGAGDAFCAGILYGVINGWDKKKSLDFANAAAACCLTDATASGGMRTEAETWKVFEKYR